jgi:protein associated with RNAse G/E
VESIGIYGAPGARRLARRVREAAWGNGPVEETGTAPRADFTTPPIWPAPDLVTMVDLDLDVLRRRGESQALLVDEDEFAEHQVLYRYPRDVVDAAQAAARDLLQAVTTRTGAFAGVHHVWLQKAAALGGGA